MAVSISIKVNHGGTSILLCQAREGAHRDVTGFHSAAASRALTAAGSRAEDAERNPARTREAVGRALEAKGLPKR
jgi:hypothetical protein